MITIQKGKTIEVVTRGAFESFYKPLGYSIVDTVSNKSRGRISEEKPVLKTNPKETKIDKEVVKSQKVKDTKKR